MFHFIFLVYLKVARHSGKNEWMAKDIYKLHIISFLFFPSLQFSMSPKCFDYVTYLSKEVLCTKSEIFRRTILVEAGNVSAQ